MKKLSIFLVSFVILLVGCSIDTLDKTEVRDGNNSLIVTERISSNSKCTNGGLRIIYGLDKDNNGNLSKDEYLNEEVLCNGTNGSDGKDGLDGEDGSFINCQEKARVTDYILFNKIPIGVEVSLLTLRNTFVEIKSSDTPKIIESYAGNVLVNDSNGEVTEGTIEFNFPHPIDVDRCLVKAIEEDSSFITLTDFEGNVTNVDLYGTVGGTPQVVDVFLQNITKVEFIYNEAAYILGMELTNEICK